LGLKKAHSLAAAVKKWTGWTGWTATPDGSRFLNGPLCGGYDTLHFLTLSCRWAVPLAHVAGELRSANQTSTFFIYFKEELSS
jgi:hypothetical protein